MVRHPHFHFPQKFQVCARALQVWLSAPLAVPFSEQVRIRGMIPDCRPNEMSIVPCGMYIETYAFAFLIVLNLRPFRSRQESLLLVFWLLIRPPAARSWDPKPPLPPGSRGDNRKLRSLLPRHSSSSSSRDVLMSYNFVSGDGRRPEGRLNVRSACSNDGM